MIPFSIAIKRMSEILLYKANECTAKLNTASEVVTQVTFVSITDDDDDDADSMVILILMICINEKALSLIQHN